MLLRLLQHTQQERFTFARGLLPLYGCLFAGVSRLDLASQQITLQPQQVAFLVHGCQRLCFEGWTALLRSAGACSLHATVLLYRYGHQGQRLSGRHGWPGGGWSVQHLQHGPRQKW